LDPKIRDRDPKHKFVAQVSHKRAGIEDLALGLLRVQVRGSNGSIRAGRNPTVFDSAPINRGGYGCEGYIDSDSSAYNVFRSINETR
jgi:hypothetical protein